MKVVLAVLAVLISGYAVFGLAYAQDFGGGVDKDGSWYAGEGLKHGDYFYYEMCHESHNDCIDFEMELWVRGDVQVGTETKWLVGTVVYDGNKIVKGNMTLGKVASEPSGHTTGLTQYAAAFKSSVVWLSAFASSYDGGGDKGPKKFRDISWGKIANIGGEQVKPLALESITVPAGTFDAVVIGWKTGGQLSQIWVVDDFPFPVKASTWVHTSEGIPPQEYRFELKDYKENVQKDPFSDVVGKDRIKPEGCPENYDLVKVRKSTKNFDYLIDLKYGPENPKQGCDIQWIINFHKKTDETEFLSQVQYDILVVDDDLNLIRSIAQDNGRKSFYSGSGQVRTFTPVDEPVGTAHYVVWIYGLSPKHIVPSTTPDYLLVEIEIEPEPGGDAARSTGEDPAIDTGRTAGIPEWIKTVAGYWTGGQSSDGEFIGAIEFLIRAGIITVSAESSGASTGADVPAWVKTTTGYWTGGQSSDDEFIGAIEYLIGQGIIGI